MVTTEVSRQSRNALLVCCVLMISLGGAVMVTGFVFEFLGIYEKISDPEAANVHFIMYPHTQYWLGLPLFALALYVLVTSFYSSTVLHTIGLVLCCFFMVASICAVGLHCTIWYISLNLVSVVNGLDCRDADNGCVCTRHIVDHDSDEKDEYESLLSLMTCSQVKHFPAIATALVILSALSFLVCLAACVIYVKILRWLDLGYDVGAMKHHETTSSQHVLLNEHTM